MALFLPEIKTFCPDHRPGFKTGLPDVVMSGYEKPLSFLVKSGP